ncbi:MAG: beta-ketoacyl synthase N-terminal-like domain-containing protein [Exilibacterium sp.]
MTNQPNRDAFVEALRRSLLENEQLKRKNKALLSASSEPIAVIAMGCRLPGGTNSPEAFWQLLMDEKRAISRFPKNRGWDQSLFAGFEGDGATEDPWWGGFIDDVDSFDADLFGISDREALAMDPQQRLLLETAWEVIERASIVPSSLKNNDTGVFVGVPHQGYIPSIEQPAPGIDGYRLNGGLTSIISGRIAYHFGFSGPAITLDTACSSSLTAIHLAVRSLRNGETSMALAGGATIMATPEVFVEMHRQGGLARDGKCKAFADGADGTVFSEGAGLLLLERLSDARKAGHPVLAVIKGTAINQDGRSNGLTAPNGPAQENVVRLALKNAGLSHTDIDAVEAHGTGTSLGDPIEANALLNTYGKNRPQPLWLGSLKSNIGHTQTASGVIAVIKMVMAIQNGLLPKSLHTEQPSSKIAWSKGGVKLLDSQRPWPDTGNPRRAAVSSFGFSGTNNHIILEQAPAVLEQTVDDGSQPPPDQEPIFNFKGYCWPVSAATPTALRAKAGQLATLIDDCSELDLAAIGYSLAATRPNLDYRMMVTAGDRNSLLKQLRDIEKAFPPALAMGVRSTQRTAFLFSGQGCHWPSMGKQLYASCQPFSQALDQICEHMDKHLSRPLKTVIFASKGSAESALMDRTDYAQPALFAFEIAMYRTLRALGVIPDYLAGHSIGEIAAVHAADGMPLEDACLLVATRGRLMQSIQIPGAMAAIEAPEQEVLASLQGVAGVVAVAAVNGPSATVISGDHDVVCEMARQWKESGHRTQQLRVSHGFHSPHIDTISESLQATAATLNFSRLSVPIVSTLTGELLAYEQYASPDYWGNQARKAVRFYDAINELASKGVKTFVEVGPDATLTSLGQGADMTDNTNNHASNNDKRWLATNRREKDETRVLLATLNRLYVQGQDIKWHQCLPARAPAVLPTYPFQRRQYWLKRVARDVALGGGLSKMAHPFLNAKIEIGDGSWLFTGTLTADQHHWLLDHAVGETAAAAGTLTAELMLSAGRQLGCEHLQTLVLHRLLVIPRHQPVDIQLRVSAAEHAGQYAASLMFRSSEHGDKGTWLLHGSGVLATSVNDLPSWPQLPAWPPVGAEALDFSGVYQRLYDDLGVTLGPAFQLIRRAWRHGDDLFIEAALPANGGQSDAGFLLHPTLLDAGMQAALIANEVAGEPQRMVLASINGLSIFAKGAKTLRAQLFLMSGDAGQPGHKHYGVRMFDAQCTPVAEVESFVLQPFTPGVKSAASYRSPYRMIWRELSLPTPPAIQNLCWIAPTPVPFDLVSVDQANHHQPIFNDVAMAIADGGLSHCDGAVLICPLPEDTDYAVASRRCAHRVTEALQTWLGSANCRDCPLIVLTQNAVAIHDTVADPLGRQHLIQAPVWGLLRSVQHQYPGHVLLVDAEHGALTLLNRVSISWLCARGASMCHV